MSAGFICPFFYDRIKFNSFGKRFYRKFKYGGRRTFTLSGAAS